MPEKRQYARLPAAFTVSYEAGGDLQSDLVTDVSAGGLFVRTASPLPVGTDIELKVVLPNNLAVTVQGRVTWVREQRGAEGMGVQFTGVTGALLAEMVERARARAR
jgi:uncharacterized protein (TIGR02266 family)